MIKTIKLKHVKPGSIFRYDATLAFKTEYRTSNGTIIAYIIGSGETFKPSGEDINNLEVEEIDLEKIQYGLLMVSRVMTSNHRASKEWHEQPDLAKIWGFINDWGMGSMEEVQKIHGWTDKEAKKMRKVAKHVRRLTHL